MDVVAVEAFITSELVPVFAGRPEGDLVAGQIRDLQRALRTGS